MTLFLDPYVAPKQITIAFPDTLFVSFFIKSIQLGRPVRDPLLLPCVLEYPHFQNARLEIAAANGICA